MKKLILTVLLAIIVLIASAQDKPNSAESKNVVKINTLSLLVGTGSLFYERQLSANISGQLGIGYLSYSFFEDTRFSGLFLTPEVRFYPKGTAINGLYLAPYFRYQLFSVKNVGGYGDYTNLGGGALIGRQWILNSGFTMDLFFGGHYSEGSFSGTGVPDTDIFEGFRPRFGFAIGFAF